MRRQPDRAASTSRGRVRSPVTTSAPLACRATVRSSSRRTRARTGSPRRHRLATTALPTPPTWPGTPVTRMGVSAKFILELFRGCPVCQKVTSTGQPLFQYGPHLTGSPQNGESDRIRGLLLLRRKLPQLGADRAERAVFVLLCRKPVHVRAIRRIDRLLSLDGKVVLQAGLGGPIKAIDVGCVVVG